MNKKKDLLGIFLAAVTGAALLICIVLRALLPRLILPRLDSGAVAVLVLAALVLDHYIVGGSRRDFRFIPLYGAFVFGVFPYAASITAPLAALTLALLGAVAFTVVTLLFDSIVDRLSSGPASRLAPAVGAIGLFLAIQCLMGII